MRLGNCLLTHTAPSPNYTASFRADTLLGVASLPLASLLEDAWVDSHVPVVALMTRAGAESQLVGGEERVQVGAADNAVYVSLCV